MPGQAVLFDFSERIEHFGQNVLVLLVHRSICDWMMPDWTVRRTGDGGWGVSRFGDDIWKMQTRCPMMRMSSVRLLRDLGRLSLVANSDNIAYVHDDLCVS